MTRARPRNRQQILLYAVQLRSLPQPCLEILQAWPELRKSPFSRSFYSTRAKTWEFTPHGCERISDHWNFRSRGRRHCRTDRPVPNGTHWTHATYDANGKVWKVQQCWDKRSVQKR